MQPTPGTIVSTEPPGGIEEQFRILVEWAADYAIVVLDAAGRVATWNAGARRLLGYEESEVLGRPFARFCAPEDLKSAPLEMEWKAAAAMGQVTHNHHLVRKDETILWCHVATIALRHQDHTLRGYALVLHNQTERRTTEQALQASEQSQQVLSEAFSDYACIASIQSNGIVSIESGTEDFTKATGYTLEELEARGGAVFTIHPDDMLVALQSLERLLAGQQDRNEMRVMRKNGELCWLRYWARPLAKEKASQIVRLHALAQDITERRQVGQVLQESEGRFRQLAENINEAFWMSDPLKTQILYVSPAYETIWGRSCQSLYQEPWSLLEAVHPDDQGQVISAFDRHSAGEPTAEEYRIVRPDGSVRWVRDRGFPIRDASGEVYRVAGIAEDITASKQAEEERHQLLLREQAARNELEALTANLKNQQKWLEAVLNLMPVPMLFIEPGTGRVLFANKAAHAMGAGEFPQGKRTAEQETIGYCTDGSGQRISDEEMPGARVARGERLDGFEVDWHLPSGKHALIIYADTLPAMHGHTATAVLGFLDITRLKHVEEELRKGHEAKDEFLAMLAHELRNPLAPIRNALHILKQPAVPTPMASHLYEMMERQVKHIARLVDDLLDVSRISRGKIELHKEIVDLGMLVGRTVEAMRPLLEGRYHELTVSLPAEALRLEADPTRLEQMLVNLLQNAAKYTDPGGHIWLTTRREGNEAVLRVRDTGIGITSEMLPRIFDLFVQVERRFDSSQGGVGIGLTLVQRLAALHGGRVEAFSAGLGQGSEFVLRLPALELLPAPRMNGIHEQSDPSPVFSLHRVLVMDDNVDSAESLAALLRLDGQEVHVAHDGPSALTLARQYEPQIAILDIGMPGMDGYEVGRRLRLQPGLENILLVALTGWGQEKDRRCSREAGFDIHLIKPAQPAELERLLVHPKLLTRRPAIK